jgi:hypothetical protein
MKHKPETSVYRFILPSALIAAAAIALILGYLGVGRAPISNSRLYGKLFIPIVRLLCYLSVGLLIGQIVEALGWTTRLARLASPLTRLGNLKPESGAAFVSSFVSGIVANTMLMRFHEEGKLTRRELILSYLANNGLPIFLVHLPTTFFIVVSLAKAAGLVYLGITFLAACLRTIGAVLVSRIVMPDPGAVGNLTRPEPASNRAEIAISILKRFRERLGRIVIFTIPIYILVFMINEWGVFLWLRTAIAGRISTDIFPVESASVIVFALVAEFSSGFAAAGAFLDAGTLSANQAGIALIAGTIAAAPIRAIRHQLPTHSGIFSLGLASQLLFLGQTMRVLSLIVITVLYILWI